MPWQMPSLSELRQLNRDNVAAGLGSAPLPNSVVRVLADSNAGLAYLTLLCLDFLSRQFLPDTAKTEWLDRHANIWVGGRKPAEFAAGTMTVTGVNGNVLPSGTRLLSQVGVEYETTEAVTIGAVATPVAIQALDPGASGNLEAGTTLSITEAIPGVVPEGNAVSVSGGIDVESDDSLRDRILTRIRKPPHGGADFDYEAWARAVPGVTRAWAAQESIGTVTVRFLMDDDRPPYGIPGADDIDTVFAAIDPVRPVSVRDLFVVAPVPLQLSVGVRQLVRSTPATHAAIEAAVRNMLLRRASPGQTIYRSWVSEAVSSAAGEDHHELAFETTVMPSRGHIGVLGSLVFLS